MEFKIFCTFVWAIINVGAYVMLAIALLRSVIWFIEAWKRQDKDTMKGQIIYVAVLLVVSIPLTLYVLHPMRCVEWLWHYITI